MKEKGYTLIEMLAVIVIMGVILTISTVSMSCVLKNMSYQEELNNSEIIMDSVKNYYNFREKMPISDVITFLPEDVVDSISEEFSTKQRDAEGNLIHDIDFQVDFIDKGYVYEIDKNAINFNGEISEKTLNNYVVVYVDKSKASKEDYEKYSRYNTTLVLKSTVESCSNDKFNFLTGSKKYKETSESLNFKVDYEYIKCPKGKGQCEE